MDCRRMYFLAVILFSGWAGAAVFQVPSEVPTIQEAFDLAVNGDTIVVAEGVHTNLNIMMRGKDITLTGANPDDWGVVSRTILQPLETGYQGAVLTFRGTETSACLVTGLTFQKGKVSGIRGNNTQATISRCWIRDNSGNTCGGIESVRGLIDRCRITGNFATSTGHAGGLFQCGSVTNCLIADNVSYNVGGLSTCDGTISNCLIVNNRGMNLPGGLYSCSGTIVHCTIANNSCDRTSYAVSGCPGPIVNCVVWGNISIDGSTALPVMKDIYPTATNVTNSCYSNAPEANGNLSVDPQLGPGYSLKAGSPCIDAGTDTVVPLQAVDYRGVNRVLNGDGDSSAVTDMGAFEYDQEGLVLVATPERLDLGGAGGVSATPVRSFELYNLDGYSGNWQLDTAGAAWLTVEPASGNISQTARTISVRVDPTGLDQGEYACNLGVVVDGTTRLVVPIVLHVGNVLRVPQDVAKIQTAIEQASDWDAILVSPGEYKENLDFLGKKIWLRSANPMDWDTVKTTIVNGQCKGSCITFNKGEGPDSIVEGLTVQLGSGTTIVYQGSNLYWVGGGVLCMDSSPTIRRCQICWNGYQSYTPGVFPPSSFHTSQSGGGIALIGDCRARIEDCLMFANSANSWGAVIYAYTAIGREQVASSVVERCTIANNYTNNSAMNWTNHVVDGSNTQLQVRNVIALYDSIQVANTEQIRYSCASFTFRYPGSRQYSYQEKISGKNGNFAANPRFVSPYNFNNPNTYDYRLKADSPCINRGDPSFVGIEQTDLAGQKRIMAGRVDMGAFEFIPETRIVHPAEGEVWQAGNCHTVVWDQPNLDRIVVSCGNFDQSLLPAWDMVTTDDLKVAGWTIGPNSGVNGYPEKFDFMPNPGSTRTGFDKGSGIYQLLGDTFRPNCRYTLKLFVGNRNDAAAVTNWQVALTAGDRTTIVTAVTREQFGVPAPGKWIEVSLALETGADGADANVGKRIGILLTGAPRVDFDEVSLEVIDPAQTATMDLELSLDNGQTWRMIAEDLPETDPWPWTIPSNVSGETCRIRAISSRPDFVAIPGGPFTIQNICSPDIPGDTNADCHVDGLDLIRLAGEWLAANCIEPTWCTGADLTRDGRIDLDDLALLAENWMK
ncbi:MAG: hypothetical protein GX455_16675 [Phycisphaerae bacterium]|nr:hypothetical protein [Phycisphaerae bacterium]